MAELSNDRPTATELLEVIADTLRDEVVPATAPHAQHYARVAANLCQILARELTSPEADVVLPLLTSADDETAAAAYDQVVELVRAKIDVNKPGYDQHGAAEEAAIIA